MRRIRTIFLVVLLATMLAELLVARDGHFAVERIFGWNALYGFLACAALILGAKGLGAFLKRPDDYYDD